MSVDAAARSLAGELAGAFRDELMREFEAITDSTVLAVSVRRAAKLVGKRESVVREAVTSGELPSWDGKILVLDLTAWFRSKTIAERRVRPVTRRRKAS
jgi:hypothetical protein